MNTEQKFFTQDYTIKIKWIFIRLQLPVNH